MAVGKKPGTSSVTKEIDNDPKVTIPPNDTVSSLNWSPTSDHFVISCWDGEVRVYHVNPNFATTGVANYKHEGPVLIARFSKDGNKVVSGGGDKKIIMYDLVTKKQTVIGTHNDAISGLDWTSDTILASTSWDKKIKFWNIASGQQIGELDTPDKIYKLSIDFPVLVAGMTDKVAIVDLNQPGVINKIREIKEVKGTISSIKAFSGQLPGFFMGTSCGKAKYLHLDESYSTGDNKKDINFRPYKPPTAPGVLKTMPLNEVLIHPMLKQVIVTITNNSEICLYDASSKTKIATLKSKFNITAAEFDRTGRILAYATGYDWNKGHKFHIKNNQYQIFLHNCPDDELIRKQN